MKVSVNKQRVESNSKLRGGKSIDQLVNSPNYKLPKGKDAEYQMNYPVLMNYLQNGLKSLLEDEDIRAGLQIVGGFSIEHINQLFSDVELEIKELCDHCPESEVEEGLERNGYTNRELNDEQSGMKIVIQIDEDLAMALEKATNEEREARLIAVIATILHETIHFGEHTYIGAIPNSDKNKTIGKWRREYVPRWGTYKFYHNEKEVGGSEEGGAAFERGIWHNDDFNSFALNSKQGIRGLKDQQGLLNTLKENGKSSIIPKI